MGVSCEKLELVSLETLSLSVSLSLYMGFIIRSSCEASLMATWLLHAHTLFIKVPLQRGRSDGGVTRERQMKGSRKRVRKRESEREKETLLAAYWKSAPVIWLSERHPFLFP